jgi:hypothetical protein
MTSSGMQRRVALLRAEYSEKHNASIMRVTRIGELGTSLAINRNRHTLRKLGISSQRSSVASYG